jgi:surface antigen
LRTHRVFQTVRQFRKASNVVASVGMVALVGLFLTGHDQLQRTQQPGEAARADSAADITCSVCATFEAPVSDQLPHKSKTVKVARVYAAGRSPVKPGSPAVVIPLKQPATTVVPPPPPQSGGSGNVFPYGTCTWWADQRYFQLHGIYVPWHTQADAWEWTARAYQYGWHVSSTAVLGAIINLQPYVQGAYGLGHVAVVEKILSNGNVIASNMAWGANPLQVTDVEFAPGPGVTFIYQ